VNLDCITMFDFQNCTLVICNTIIISQQSLRNLFSIHRFKMRFEEGDKILDENLAIQFHLFSCPKTPIVLIMVNMLHISFLVDKEYQYVIHEK